MCLETVLWLSDTRNTHNSQFAFSVCVCLTLARYCCRCHCCCFSHSFFSPMSFCWWDHLFTFLYRYIIVCVSLWAPCAQRQMRFNEIIKIINVVVFAKMWTVMKAPTQLNTCQLLVILLWDRCDGQTECENKIRIVSKPMLTTQPRWPAAKQIADPMLFSLSKIFWWR